MTSGWWRVTWERGQSVKCTTGKDAVHRSAFYTVRPRKDVVNDERLVASGIGMSMIGVEGHRVDLGVPRIIQYSMSGHI